MDGETTRLIAIRHYNETRLYYLRHEALCLYSLLSRERLEEHLWV